MAAASHPTRVETRVCTDVPDVSIVWIGLSAVPRDVVPVIETICARIDAVPRAHKCVLHIEHCDTDDLVPPDLQGFLALAGALFEKKTLIDARVHGTCLQAKRVDETVQLAHGIFLTMYRPKHPFEVLCGADAARAFIERIVAG